MLSCNRQNAFLRGQKFAENGLFQSFFSSNGGGGERKQEGVGYRASDLGMGKCPLMPSLVLLLMTSPTLHMLEHMGFLSMTSPDSMQLERFNSWEYCEKDQWIITSDPPIVSSWNMVSTRLSNAYTIEWHIALTSWNKNEKIWSILILNCYTRKCYVKMVNFASILPWSYNTISFILWWPWRFH